MIDHEPHSSPKVIPRPRRFPGAGPARIAAGTPSNAIGEPVTRACGEADASGFPSAVDYRDALGKEEGVPHTTIRDVAREAAVSVASVSRAMNGHPSVLPETRERVLAAARKLDYVPHAGARSLSMAQAHTIGVVLPDLHGEFFSEIVRGMDRAARQLGYKLLLSAFHSNPAEVMEALRTMRGRVDGLLIMAPEIDPERLAGSLPPGTRAVLLNTPEVGGCPSFRIQNEAGALRMVRHLRTSGCRRIVHITGPLANKDARERLHGFRVGMAEEPGLEAEVVEGDFTEEAGARAAEQLVARIGGIDAIFAANDMMAIGCMLVLRDAGIAVPAQVRVAGFDDVPAARYVMPGLTTMRVNIAEVGACAMRAVVDAISGPPEQGIAADRLFEPELVVRSSSRG